MECVIGGEEKETASLHFSCIYFSGTLFTYIYNRVYDKIYGNRLIGSLALSPLELSKDTFIESVRSRL